MLACVPARASRRARASRGRVNRFVATRSRAHSEPRASARCATAAPGACPPVARRAPTDLPPPASPHLNLSPHHISAARFTRSRSSAAYSRACAFAPSDRFVGQRGALQARDDPVARRLLDQLGKGVFAAVKAKYARTITYYIVGPPDVRACVASEDAADAADERKSSHPRDESEVDDDERMRVPGGVRATDPVRESPTGARRRGGHLRERLGACGAAGHFSKNGVGRVALCFVPRRRGEDQGRGRPDAPPAGKLLIERRTRRRDGSRAGIRLTYVDASRRPSTSRRSSRASSPLTEPSETEPFETGAEETSAGTAWLWRRGSTRCRCGGWAVAGRRSGRRDGGRSGRSRDARSSRGRRRRRRSRAPGGATGNLGARPVPVRVAARARDPSRRGVPATTDYLSRRSRSQTRSPRGSTQLRPPAPRRESAGRDRFAERRASRSPARFRSRARRRLRSSPWAAARAARGAEPATAPRASSGAGHRAGGSQASLGANASLGFGGFGGCELGGGGFLAHSPTGPAAAAEISSRRESAPGRSPPLPPRRRRNGPVGPRRWPSETAAGSERRDEARRETRRGRDARETRRGRDDAFDALTIRS